ncbi:tyrosine-type recombinase/integrase [Sporosarcina psychrophila]|uniref:Integrase n=1 Tax=Sporosarcina psychrophila TaxID=1476 RepID=A0ABV2KCU8_SPOPS
MASYKELAPTKKGEPRIKITVEKGYDEETGERLRFFKTVRMKTMSDRAINKAITEFEIEVDGMKNLEKLENIKFGEFAHRWMDVYVRVDLTIKTRDFYKLHLDYGILEELSHFKLSGIKTFHLVECFKKWKENRKASIVLGMHVALKSIFAKAVEWRVLKDNPMNGMKPPKVEKKQKELSFYDEDQLKHLFGVLENVYPKHAMQIKLAALVGLRMAEVAGVRMGNIDFDKNTILIDKTLQYDKERKKLILGPTKNKKARQVNVPDFFMKELKNYAKVQLELQVASGSAWNPLLDDKGEPINFLFTREDGFPAHPQTASTNWGRIIKKYNLPRITFHDLRHSYASYMVSKNVNFKIIQQQLGHSDIRITIDTYSHLTERDKEKASDLFNEIL